MLTDTCDQGVDAVDVFGLVVEKISRKRWLTKDISTQSVLTFWKEVGCSEFADSLDIRKFCLDVVEDAQDLAIGRTEDSGNIGWGANGEAKDFHAIDCLRTRGEEANVCENIVAVVCNEGGWGETPVP